MLKSFRRRERRTSGGATMSLAKSLPCADLGTAFCPCALAASGQCTYCTRLRGEDRCACDWSGVCVLLHRGPAPSLPANVNPPQGAVRRTRAARIISAKTLTDGVCELWVRAPAWPCEQLRRPGTFVLIRPASLPGRFDVPLTVAGVKGDTFRLIFKIAGPKTQPLALLTRGGDVIWRGPYYSGLLGLRNLMAAHHATTPAAVPATALVVARGVGQAVALPVVSHLVTRGIRCEVMLDPRGSGGGFARSELESLSGLRVEDIRCMKPAGATLLAGAVERIAHKAPPGAMALISCGSDLQHRWLVSLRPALLEAAGGRPLHYAAVNNSLVVCGEGVCGACVRRLPDGARFRGCKADAPPELLWSQEMR
jgi:dihydroorotate dehydrogenase electron transfer subunit